MMEVSMSDFFGVILLLTFEGAGISFFLDRRRDRSRANAIKKSVIRCRVCGCAYQAPHGHAAIPCPECGRENQRGRDRRLG
jgi:predicted RNA-binding Zn-ribbon protein involved in translation (DUF1610 family)